MTTNAVKFSQAVHLGNFASDPAQGNPGDTYFNTVSKKMKFYNGTIWSIVGSGSGSGSINFLTNGDFEDGIVFPWATFANTANPTPPNNNTAGTGGSPTATLTVNNTMPLSGLYDAIFSKPNTNCQGQGFSEDYSLDQARKGALLQIDFDYKSAGGFVSGANSDLQFFMLDKDAGVLIPVDNPFVESSIGHYTSRFLAVNTASLNFRLIAYIATTNALAWTFEIDNVVVGLPSLTQVASSNDKVLWSGYFDGGYQWTRSGGVYGDFSLSASGAFVETNNVGFGTVTAAAGNLPGVTFAPKAKGIKYKVTAKFIDYQNTNNSNRAYRLWDGTTVIDAAAGAQNANPTNSAGGQIGTTIVLEGYWTAPSTSPATLTVQGQENGGTTYITALLNSNALQWEIEQATPEQAPIGASVRTTISQLIANGTQVTGGPPTALGQYRALYRNTSGAANNVGDASGFVAPTVADGFLLYGNVPATTTGNPAQPTILQVFIGFNKCFQVRPFISAGHVDPADIGHFVAGAIEQGVFIAYDPFAGVVTFDANYIEGGTISSRNAAANPDPAVYSNSPSVYIDAVISDNPIGVGLGGYVGEVKFLATNVVPDGCLELGQAVSRTTYARLFGKIGTFFGIGDGSTTFDLPPRGAFPRIWDHGSGNDPDAGSRFANNGGNSGDNVGSFQSTQNLYHGHLFGVTTGGGGTPGTSGATAGISFYSGAPYVYPAGGNQSNPFNVNFMGVIVY